VTKKQVPSSQNREGIEGAGGAKTGQYTGQYKSKKAENRSMSGDGCGTAPKKKKKKSPEHSVSGGKDAEKKKKGKP